MERILELGFVEAGEWFLLNGRLDFNLHRFKNERYLLYAFTSENLVLYIGKTDNPLNTRMMGYKNAGVSQRTNIRVRAEIVSLLELKMEMKIYVLTDDSDLEYKGVKIRLSAGLEDNLISKIRPKWNFRGNNETRIKEQEMGTANEDILVESNQTMIIDKTKIQSFVIKTNEPKNGRINFPKKQIDYGLLPEFNSIVTVFLGKEGDTFFEANLIDSGNGNARINKALLKDWYAEEHLFEQETFNLDIINPTTFRIYK